MLDKDDRKLTQKTQHDVWQSVVIDPKMVCTLATGKGLLRLPSKYVQNRNMLFLGEIKIR